MADNYATIEDMKLELHPLEVIRIIATRYGYEDVDVEPLGQGEGYTVSAHRKSDGAPLSVRGADLEACCKKFCARVLTETDR